MDKFILHSEYAPTGDQPQAIEELVQGFKEGKQFQTLLGVTGSGKTFTMANVIAALNKPTLIISHNKTLAGQLYGEFKEFFPENAVEYFVSYYDYYQPEAYVHLRILILQRILPLTKRLKNCVCQRRHPYLREGMLWLSPVSAVSMVWEVPMNIRTW